MNFHYGFLLGFFLVFPLLANFPDDDLMGLVCRDTVKLIPKGDKKQLFKGREALTEPLKCTQFMLNHSNPYMDCLDDTGKTMLTFRTKIIYAEGEGGPYYYYAAHIVGQGYNKNFDYTSLCERKYFTKEGELLLLKYQAQITCNSTKPSPKGFEFYGDFHTLVSREVSAPFDDRDLGSLVSTSTKSSYKITRNGDVVASNKDVSLLGSVYMSARPLINFDLDDIWIQLSGDFFRLSYQENGLYPSETRVLYAAGLDNLSVKCNITFTPLFSP